MPLSGAQLLDGSVWFTFFAPATEGGVVTGFDWFVGLWAMGAAVALLLVALAPVRPPARRLQWAWWVMGVHLVWALVKLVGYDELPVSAVVVAVDAGILALLWLAGRGRRGD